MSRTGVLGGMFDPIHNGHIEAARFAYQNVSLDHVKLVPCSIPNHRNNAFTSSQHRMLMAEMAVSQFPELKVDGLEIDREGVSYTVDTLRQLKNLEPDNNLVFILGLDSFNSLTDWKEWESLFALCSFFVLARESETVKPHIESQLDLGNRTVASPKELSAQQVGQVCFAQGFNYDLSSTEVRSKIAKGLDVSTDVDKDVNSYIKAHHLYI